MPRIDPEWLMAPGARAVCAMLETAGHRALFVGGCVRDALIGRPAADIDIATNARPETVLALAAAAGIKAAPTGVAHGTVTLAPDGSSIEVTTLRRDVETDGRRAVVAFTDNIAEDAGRRDFTMNALYATPEGMVVDPLGGLEDLRARRVRFVGDPAVRIAEDALRILRFFRFHAQFGDPAAGLDAPGLAACAAGRDRLDRLSRERVGAEMVKILAAPDPAQSVEAMAATGVLALVAPGADAGVLPQLVLAETAATIAPSWRRRLAALGSGADWAERLKLSKADVKALAVIGDALNSNVGPALAAHRFGAEAARDAVLIRAAQSSATPPLTLEAEIRRGSAAQFPLRAADLALKGPALGALLRQLEAVWEASDFALDRDALLALARRDIG